MRLIPKEMKKEKKVSLVLVPLRTAGIVLKHLIFSELGAWGCWLCWSFGGEAFYDSESVSPQQISCCQALGSRGLGAEFGINWSHLHWGPLCCSLKSHSIGIGENGATPISHLEEISHPLTVQVALTEQ